MMAVRNTRTNQLDADTIKNILLNSVQGGDVDGNGNLIAKVSLTKLFQQFAEDMKFIKATLEGDMINLYIAASVNLQPIQVDNGITLDLSKYTGTAIIKIPIRKKFIDDLVQLTNMPIVGVEEVKTGNTSDVIVKVNTGRKVTSVPETKGGEVDF